MKQKKIAALTVLLGLSSLLTAQFHKGQMDTSFIPRVYHHYRPEYTAGVLFDTLAWALIEDGLHVSFVSTNEAYFSNEVPDVQKTGSWKGTGWKGERLNAGLLFWSGNNVEQIRLNKSDLTSKRGDTIKQESITLNIVRYVLSDYPYAARNASCWASYEEKENAYLLPDLLDPFERFTLPGKSVRPVWIRIDIPRDCRPGIYTGTMEVRAMGFEKELTLEIEVQEFVLPEPGDWKFRLDLWQNPWVIARHYNIEPWSEEHVLLLKKHLALYAGAGGKFITTYAVHSPWNDNSYTIEESMIESIRENDGSWAFDYTLFDDYVELAMEAGITDAITIYTLLPWGHRFRYFDEGTGNYIYGIWPPGSEEYESYCLALLEDLKKHLVQKKWMAKTYLGINENPLEDTKAAIEVIHKHSKDWKITYEGKWESGLSDLVDDYSVVLYHEPDQEEIEKRLKKGFTTTFYVCCTPPKPNNFLFSPPVENTWMGWYTAAYGYQGFLRWAYDAWPYDPRRDARHIYGPAGDCYLVYPGAKSSIRLEKIREGIVDFEKISILEDFLHGSGDKQKEAALKELQMHLKSFLDIQEDQAADIEAKIKRGKELLNNISGNFSPGAD